MKVGFATFGCKLNQYETQLMMEKVLKANCEISSLDKADVCIINSCAVTAKASKEARMLAKRLSNSKTVIYTGCDSYLEENLSPKIILVGNSLKYSIDQLIKNPTSDTGQATKFYPIDETISDFFNKSRAFVKIQEGCNNHCTYCIIPFLRSKQRDKPSDIVIKEIETLYKKGFYEIVITGTNIGSYNNFYELLKAIDNIKGFFRVRISSIEPMYLNEEIIKLIASGKFAKHLHIPLQSGSDKVLKLMKRDYTTKAFARLVEMCDRYGIFVGTDVIVGFFGEDDEEFKKTYNFIKELPLTYGHIFSYSIRPFTPASKIKLPLPRGPVAKQRNRMLKELFEEKKKKSIKRLIGKEIEFIVETTKIENGKYFRGLSSQYFGVAVKNFKEGLVKAKLLDFNDNIGIIDES
ncbi:tRNA (N(6)-L-threonylcarbamoyladenosine(37)-C(2))-methylthiotransferase MtaB [Hippea jasoniae]|uniref:tRNA (N(6)-L-threonylcarbamoyladenosine(37)-C(2))- methylthiotransferase MtaB n=1 Tax=Hippea jasoniae TaxID=944479 RepID=UPI00055299BB|nr:tRNA (N(6)-L-threonylcarbamoyladenosine(37)-C(2))-methylthiotransferase MtaB [Hippea jasoniae]